MTCTVLGWRTRKRQHQVIDDVMVGRPAVKMSYAVLRVRRTVIQTDRQIDIRHSDRQTDRLVNKYTSTDKQIDGWRWT